MLTNIGQRVLDGIVVFHNSCAKLSIYLSAVPMTHTVTYTPLRMLIQ